MALEPVSLKQAPSPLPGDVVTYLESAEQLIRTQLRHAPVHSYVSSDFPLVYRALREISDRGLAPGDLFCEWGSGFGVVASLAAMLDFDAYGIEIEPELVGLASSLAAQFELPVRFACGNFIPGGDDNFREDLGDSPYLDAEGDPAYEDLGLELSEFDLVFAYPWPGEERTLENLFEHHARPDALLILHHGLDGVIVQRKPRPAPPIL